MQLSGLEVQELFDFAARRTAGRGCASQIQIAGARVRINCSGCDRVNIGCTSDAECTERDPAARRLRPHDEQVHRALQRRRRLHDPHRRHVRSRQEGLHRQRVRRAGLHRAQGHALQRRQGLQRPGRRRPRPAGHLRQDAAASADGLCLSLISPTNLYELATSNYLAGGGSGFRVLQRNTTQFDTKVQQRDALIDYLRTGKPCGYDPVANQTPDGLKACVMDARLRRPHARRARVPGTSSRTAAAAPSPAPRSAPARTAPVVASARTAATTSRSSTSSGARARPTRRPARSPSRPARSPARSARSSRASTRRSAASPTTAWS